MLVPIRTTNGVRNIKDVLALRIDGIAYSFRQALPLIGSEDIGYMGGRGLATNACQCFTCLRRTEEEHPTKYMVVIAAYILHI